jgi:hypothetical protein
MSRDINNLFINQITSIASRDSFKACRVISAYATIIVRYLNEQWSSTRTAQRSVRARYALPLMIGTVCIALTGCGAGGYAGNSITSLSSSAITIDAGQAFQFTAALSGNEPVSWALASNSCSSNACGSLTSMTGATVTYTAPLGITSQLKLTLTATVTGTGNSSAATITVNPDPVISGTPPSGTVGTAYSTTLIATGGTAPLKWSLVGPLPGGLSFDATTDVISGTPTTTGTFSFAAQIVDSSDIPYTVKAPESIVITVPVSPLVVVSGQPPAGTVGVAYSTSLSASGGTTPYAWSLTSGTLPAGLTLSTATGVISGMPITQGTSVFTAQVQDAAGNKASAVFSITINAAEAPLTLTLATLPSGVVGVPYSAMIGVSGGTAPYSCLLAGGTLPAGLTLSASCLVSGTPTTAGTSILSVKATDSSSPVETVTGPESITIAPAGTLALTSPPNGTVGTPYAGAIGVAGGTAPYTCVITAGTLPAGLTLGAACVITGTPTTAGTANLTVNATDSSNPVKTITGPVTLTISPTGLTLTLSTLPGATVGVPYSATIGVSGGTAPYSCIQAGGTLPAGLTLSAVCVVSGTPTTAGTSVLSVKATDSSSPAETVTGPEAITVSPVGVLVLASPPNGTVGTPYTGTIGVNGGTAPYTCVITAGTLPAGLTLGAGCVVSGTPTTAGTASLTVKATDSSSPLKTVTGPVTLTISPTALTLTLSTLPGATVGVPYSATIGVSGGTAPYSCLLTVGTLPAGLTLSPACVVSGTPTIAGTSVVTVKATDSSSPAETVSGPESITVSPAPLTLTLSTLPNATVGVPYSATVGVSGGTAPYSCILASGTLPAGLTLSAACVVSGTPTVAGTSSVMVKATDASHPVETVTGPESITVSPAPLSILLSNLPNATVGTPYTATIGVSGGTAPYSCTLTGGTLPAGLTLSAACVVSGTPTVAETVILTIKATDSTNPVETVSGPVGLTVLPAAPTLTITSPPSATVGVPYTGPIGITGGQGPYACTITAGTLPAGLSLTGCTITGTPTTAGTTTVTVKVTDSSNPVVTATGPVTVTVLPATVTLTLSSPPNATVSVPYTGTIGVAGGTAPYTCTLTAGTLPAGLSLSAGCVVSGTPTTAGTSTVTIHATDSATPAASTTGPVSITVSPIPPLSLTGSLPNATLGVPYTQTLLATGGLTPYKYSLTAGALPAGLNLSTTGVISGTPTVVGASSFTVTVTDTEATPQTASLPLVLLVVYPTTATDAELIGPYAFLFQGYDDVLAGVLAYQTATVASFTADGTGVISSGELDSNHQSSDPSGNTVSSHQFLGTYTLATDNRGYMTITTLNADGTTAGTSTYAIVVKAPVAPATIATQADLIEFDDNSLQGTRGSGTMLAQKATAFAAGLKGSYAFGLSGDTPCLPSCTLGIVAGPAASVGQFTTDGTSLLTSGASDANIATKSYANAPLTGSYGSADGNGRLDLTMDTAGTPAGIYPTDYAVYLVSANQAFVMSTDKHSSYLLLAGTAQLQTQATFSDASMSGGFVGYENAQSDPGLLGTILQDTLNLNSATIFRATGNAAGKCDFTNVDVAGLTGILNLLLGPFKATGQSTCTVAANGRGVLDYPGLLPPAPREFYLVSPNNGYYLETGYAGLGRFEPQTGSPFSLGTLDGTFIYASLPASSLASINTSGIFTADGAGNATTEADLNIGVGTINVLETNLTTTATYHLTDATAGRYLLGATTVIYAIAPGRFVLVDTNILTTAPSISLLY